MARSLSLVIAAAFFSLIGCGGAPASGPVLEFDPCQPLALVVDPSATPAQAAGLAAGIAFWNTMAGARLSIVTADASVPANASMTADAPDGSSTAPAPASPLPAVPVMPIHFQAAAGAFHGFYDAPTGQIFLNEDLSDHVEAVVAAHEVGHSFGLLHIPPTQRPSVMNPGNLVIEPNSADIDTLRMRWGMCE